MVSRYLGGIDFVPVFGVIHHLTGEPVRLHVTDTATGRTVTRTYDLVADAIHDHPKVPSKSALGESAERWMQPGSRPRLRVG